MGTISVLALRIMAMREKISSHEAELNKLKALLKQAEDGMRQALVKAGNGAENFSITVPDPEAGRRYTFTPSTVERFNVQDWNLFFDWMVANNVRDAVQRRVGADAARRCRDQDGSLPPGVGVFVEPTLSIRTSKAPQAKPGDE